MFYYVLDKKTQREIYYGTAKDYAMSFMNDDRELVEGKDAWREREYRRLLDPKLMLPWAHSLKAVHNHYAHRSLKDENLLAYTKSIKKGIADVQTVVRPGKYLKEFYPNLSSKEIADLAAIFGKLPELKIARTEEEFERVYRNGPRSCMSYNPRHFNSPFHPVRVYAGGDLTLAYIEDYNKSTNSTRVTARALIWEEKKIYYNIYGDYARLSPILAQHGYKNDYFEGARIKRFYDAAKARFIVPFVDGTSYATLDDKSDDFLILTRQSSMKDLRINLAHTNGYSNHVALCRCKKLVNPNKTYKVRDTFEEPLVTLCESCFKEEKYSYCSGSHAYYLKDKNEFIYVNNINMNKKFYEANYFVCKIENVLEDKKNGFLAPSLDGYICAEFIRDYFYCAGIEAFVPNSLLGKSLKTRKYSVYYDVVMSSIKLRDRVNFRRGLDSDTITRYKQYKHLYEQITNEQAAIAA